MKKDVLTTLLTMMMFGAILGCNDKIEPGHSPSDRLKTVKAAVAEARVIQRPFFYEAVGTVTAKTYATLSGKLMGIVREVRAREGDFVKEGQQLVVIDQRQVTAQLNQARAALAEARRARASAKSARDAARPMALNPLAQAGLADR